MLSVTPLAWYQMDADSGTVLTDSSGNGQTGTVIGSAAFTPGVSGNALDLTGGYASLPTGIVSSLTDFTITAWVKITNLAIDSRIFDFGSGTNSYMSLTEDSDSSNGLQFAITNNGITSEQQVNGPAINANVWTHIAVTLAGNLATMYVNGVAVAGNAISLNPSSLGSTTQNYLGKSQYSTDPSLFGSIDDFRIYGGALSAEQLQPLAALSLPSGWTDTDIGSPAVAGSAGYFGGGLWTVNGGGTDISGTADQFNFASTSLSGDVVLVAEMSSLGITNSPAAAGLMIRSSTAAGSVEASLLMTPSSGVSFQTRTVTGGTTQQAVWSGISGPVWLQLDRIGTNISGFLSNDDLNWYPVGAAVSVPLGDPVIAGLAIMSGSSTAISTTNFTNVSVAQSTPPTVATAASASPAVFTGYSTALSVLGADDMGEKNLTYSWAATGTPPAPVSFSANASNAAKSTQATFTVSGTYNLTVTITDPDGLSVQSTAVVTVSVPPLPPSGVTAVWSGATVNVNWLPVTGAQSYNIYRATTIGGEGSVAYASDVTATSFVDTAVTTGTSYYYEVTAVDATPLESGRSFEVAALPGAFTSPIISEFMGINNVTLADSDGGYPDWLELYNPTAGTVMLTGDYLTDSTKTLNKWQFPAATLAPNAFLIVFADSANDTDSTGAFHTNFNIGGSGGYLALVGSNGTTVLSAYNYPQQVTDVSYGVGLMETSTGSGVISSFGGVGFLAPTPNAANGSVLATAIAAEPTFNYPDGFYNATISLTITSATPGASIYYTLDGTTPTTTNGTLYTGALTVSGETTIRAIAVAPESLPSPAAAASYIYLSQVLTQAANGQAPAGWPVDWGYSLVHYGMDPTVVDSSAYASEITQDLLDLPSVSLNMSLEDLFDPVTGIYSESQLSQGEQRPASIELINPTGPVGFQADVGVSLKGDYSARAMNAKHGFDIHFSDQFGISELDYPVFGADAAQTFDEIQLRTDQENSWSFINPQNFLAVRDEFSSALLAATGQAAEHFKVCFLYIDGMFWGLYDIIEKPNDDFAASYYGGSASGYDVVKATFLGAASGNIFGDEAEDGTLNAWNQLFVDISTLDLTNNANYEMIQGNNPDGTRNSAYPDLLDVNNLVQYMLTEYYVGNNDAPFSVFVSGPNNFYAIRPTDGSFGFRFVATDSEWTLINANDNSVNIAYDNLTNSIGMNPAYIFQYLEVNPSFRNLVAEVAQQDFLNGGPMSVSATTPMFNNLVAEVQGPIVGESARWGNELRPTEAYTRDTDWQALVNYMTSTYFPTRTQIVLNELEAVGLYPPILALPTYSQYGGSVPYGYQLTMGLSGAGSIYYTIDGSDPENTDGSISSNAIAYTGPLSILNNVEVKARAYSSGDWSALVDSSFTVVANVRITELNYDPPKPPSGSPYNNDDFEFVELENFSNFSANLAGVAFTNGIDYTFGNVTLGPWQVGVLVHNLAAFQSRYGTSINVLGSYESTGQSFSNSGEAVELQDAAGNVLDHFNYTPCVTAYPTAHEGGASLEVLDPYGTESLNLAANWRASLATNGTPGTIPLILGSAPAYLMLDGTGQHIELWNASVNTGTPEAIPIAEVYAITFAAAAAGDSLTVDFSNGNPLKTTSFAFNGGTTTNALTVVGTANADTFTVNASTGVLVGSFGSETFTYSNTSTLTFVGNGGADTLIQAAQPGGGAALAFNDTAGNPPSSLDQLNVSSGTFSFAAPAAGSGVQPISLASLWMGDNVSVSLNTAPAVSDRWVLVLGAMNLPSTSQLDLGGNDLIVRGGSYSAIYGDVISGLNAAGSSAWTGLGIASSAAATDTRHATTLAVMTPDAASVFDNQQVSSSDVIVKFTYNGDANLDGKVDASDYSRIDNGYLNQLTGWYNGDFNYDGVINGSDYTLIDNAFNSQGAAFASLFASPAAIATSAIAKPATANSRSAARTSAGILAAKLRSQSPGLPFAVTVFQTQTPINLAGIAGESIELSLQDKDLLETLSSQSPQ
jgi:hypothetical protein